MDGASVLIVLSLAVLSGLFLARPLIGPRRTDARIGADRLAHLRADLDQQLRLLEELELDREMGKTSPEAFAAERPVLVARAAALMRQIDEAQASSAPEEADRELEAEIEPGVRHRRRNRWQPAEPHCTQCGMPLRRGDRFCGHCGARVSRPEVGA